MKLTDIFKNINKDKKYFLHLSEYASLFFGIEEYFDEEQSDKLTTYILSEWVSLGYRLGYKVHFFEDKPIAISYQLEYRSEEKVEWISIELYLKVKQYIESHIIEDYSHISLIDTNTEFGEFFKINSYDEVLTSQKNKAYYNNEIVSIIDYQGAGTHNYDEVLIQSDKVIKWVNMKDLLFRINII